MNREKIDCTRQSQNFIQRQTDGSLRDLLYNNHNSFNAILTGSYEEVSLILSGLVFCSHKGALGLNTFARARPKLK